MDLSGDLREAVINLYESMGTEDMPTIDRLFSCDDAVHVIGTDPSEWWKGHELIVEGFRAQFGRSGTRRVEPGELTTYVEGTVGWAADRRTIHLPNGKTLTIRETFVFHREEGDWKIVQMHASLAVPDTMDIGQ